jgi:hypothetical protein
MATTKEMQARARAKRHQAEHDANRDDKIQALKEQAKKIKADLGANTNFIQYEVELTGASKGYHFWAAPAIDYRLDSDSSSLKSIDIACKDLLQALPTTPKTRAYMLAAVNYITQAIANGITNTKDKGPVFGIASEIMRRGIEPVCSDISRVEVRMSTMPSPMSVFGMPGDKFVPGFGEDDYIRVYNRAGDLVVNLTMLDIAGKHDPKEVSVEFMTKMLARAMA